MKTFRLETSQASPRVKSNKQAKYTGTRTTKGLTLPVVTRRMVSRITKPIRWLTTPASTTVSGRISLGNRVRVTRFALSMTTVLERINVS